MNHFILAVFPVSVLNHPKAIIYQPEQRYCQSHPLYGKIKNIILKVSSLFPRSWPYLQRRERKFVNDKPSKNLFWGNKQSRKNQMEKYSINKKILFMHLICIYIIHNHPFKWRNSIQLNQKKIHYIVFRLLIKHEYQYPFFFLSL